MDSGRLAVEVEVGPRFEIFYALHKLFAPTTAAADRWRKSARSRLGVRLRNDAENIAPDPLMWAILADSALAAKQVGTFEELIKAVEGRTPDEFRTSVLAGVPDIRGSSLRGTFEDLLRDPDDYRNQLIALLRSFWTRVFADDFAALRPEMNRVSRQLLAASANATHSNIGDRLGIPIEIDEAKSRLTAGRGGYAIPLSRVGRVVLIPSAFNLGRWWTKRDDKAGPVDFFFPLNDGTIGPNDALSGSVGATPSSAVLAPDDSKSAAPLRPEIIFRALGDTTRYAIATILARSPTTPSDLSRQLSVSKPTITHHVHALRDAGLILDGAEGGRLALDRSRLEQLSESAVSSLFSSEGKLKLAKTRKKTR